MYPVSEKWQEEDNLILRNRSYVRIVFGIQDPDAPALSNPSDNGHLLYSAVESVDLGASAPFTYQTLERNRFILDGTNPLPSDTNYTYQGYVGNLISDDNGEWSIPPAVTIQFDDYVSMAALTLEFDKNFNEYPEQIKITAEKDGEVVLDKTKYPDDTYYVVSEQIPLCTKITITWLKSKIPHRRARLLSLIYGIINDLQSQDIVTCKSTKEIDLISSKLPKQDFEFTIVDTEMKYDPENPSGVWEYLESRQPVTYYYGYELSNGTIEWIPWGMSYSTGDITVTKQQKMSNVTVKCAGLAEHLNMTYTEGKYYPDGISLYDLADEVMNFSGFSNLIELDDSLKQIYTHNPLSAQSVGECLQVIANAGRCIISYSRGGYLRILKENTENVGFSFDFHKMETPETSKIAPLRKVSGSYTSYTVESTVSNAVDAVEAESATPQEFTFEHSAYTNLSIELSGTLQMTGTPKYFAYKTVVTLSGSGTVTIKGNKLVSNTVSYAKQFKEVGEDLEGLTNELIDNAEDMAEYIDWTAEYAMRRTTYKSNDRGYPQLDCGDKVGYTSNFDNDVEVTLVKQTLTYNGAIKGSGEFIIE